MRRSTTLALAATATASLVLSGCGGSSGGSSDGKQQVAVADVNARPLSDLKQGGTLRLPIEQWIDQYNSNTADGAQGDASEITADVEPVLFRTDEHGVPRLDPDYLVSAQVTSTSPQVVTYQLNPKARWSDGTQLSWRDFQAQWKALNGGNTAYQAADTSGYDQISGVAQGADPQQVKVTFSSPYADWQRLFTPLFPAAAYSTPQEFNNGWTQRIPITAGAFRITTYDKTDQTLTLTPDPKWWGTRPKLSSLVYRAMAQTAITDAFLNGEIDEAQAEDPDDYRRLVKDKDAQIRTGSRWDEVHVTINGAHGPLKDVRVRQAIGEAINRQATADAFGSGLPYKINVLGNHFFMPDQQGYQDNAGVYGKFDPAAAGKLLDEAGWKDNGAGKPRTKDGQKLEVGYLLSAGSPQTTVDTAQLIQQMLGQIGIKVDIQKVPDNDFFDKYVNLGNFDLVSFRNTDSMYPSTLVSVYQEPQGKNLFQNFGSVSTPQIDALLKQAAGTTDKTRAQALYNQADKLIWQAGNSVELFQRPQVDAVRTGLANFGASGLVNFTDYSKVGWVK
ncbi:ABC transporter family substrate-binding protein [Streptomyces sp. ICBB 8177]|uniref:ABC transporter family substrate-binding protein n=1 Tax=Streptomyces sp. ICBB 8177 TaxID=563922 RepID=UPI000D68388E|nr:ABC transporter family substrate-binding protein [Streptomyces sp. ICBB 8177]PWI44022.1 ABC transporter substrate-binding protein [Streptomyces sp. ICBB 8177]